MLSGYATSLERLTDGLVGFAVTGQVDYLRFYCEIVQAASVGASNNKVQQNNLYERGQYWLWEPWNILGDKQHGEERSLAPENAQWSGAVAVSSHQSESEHELAHREAECGLHGPAI